MIVYKAIARTGLCRTSLAPAICVRVRGARHWHASTRQPTLRTLADGRLTVDFGVARMHFCSSLPSPIASSFYPLAATRFNVFHMSGAVITRASTCYSTGLCFRRLWVRHPVYLSFLLAH